MPSIPRAKERRNRCEICSKTFPSWGRLRHHWAAEHVPKTSGDILRTGDVMRKTHGISILNRLRLLPVPRKARVNLYLRGV